MKPAPRLRIEPMAADDLPEVMAIEAVSFSAPWPEAAFRHELEANAHGVFIVARLDQALAESDCCPAGQLIGYGGMWLHYDEAHIVTLAVAPGWRGRGIGTRLLLELMVEAMAAGMACVTLEVRVSNLAARRLYEKHGFVVAGCRRRYYVDNGEDALIMTTPSLADNEWRARLVRRWQLAQVGWAEGDPTASETTT